MDERLVDVTARTDLERRLIQMGKTQAMNTSTIMALRAEISAVKADKSGNVHGTTTLDGTEREVRDLEIKCATLEADLSAARHSLAQSLVDRTVMLEGLSETARTRAAELKERMAEEGESVLGGLVADNTLLRHDNGELVVVLGEVRRELRVLREENEGLRRASGASAGSTEINATTTTPRISTPTTTDTFFPRPLTLNTSASQTHTRHYSLTPSLASVRSNPPPYTHGRQDSWTTTTSPRVRRQDSAGGWPVIEEAGEHVRDVSTSSSSSVDPQQQQQHQHQQRRKRLSLTPSFRPPVSPLGGEGYFPSPTTTTTTGGRGMCSVGVQTEAEGVEGTEGEGKATLRGLGFEDAGSPSTTQTPISRTPVSTHSSLHTPLAPSSHTPLLSPFAPLAVESTTHLLLLMEHTTKLLQRVRQADVPTLTRRLRKQHLAGDVGYLSTSTVKALTRDVAEMRGYFRGVLEEEKRQGGGATTTTTSLVAKKEFMQLVKLFREMLTELVEMRGTVNQVILDPGAVVRMREEVQAAEEGETVEVKRAGQGLGGWIAPTIQKLFTGAEPTTSGPTARGPKLEPSTEASTTYVNIEFASSGIIRRSTRAEEDMEPAVRPKARPAMTLGDGSVRSQGRAGLMGIFAGARPVNGNGNAQTLRVKPSLEFNQRRPQHRRRISNAVDAVIDQPVPEDTMPPLLERTLRPRGLSDSSIRSTYQSHAVPARSPAAVPAPSGSYWPDSKMVKTLGRRIHAYTTAEAPSRPPIAVAVPETLGAQNRSYMDMLAGTSPIPGHSFSRGEGER